MCAVAVCSHQGAKAAAPSSVFLRSRDLRCVSSPDPVLGEGGAGSESGGVRCGGVVPPWESVLLWRPSLVILRSCELRCVSSLDPVLGEGEAGSEGGGVCCGGVVPPWESALLRRPPSFSEASSLGAFPPLNLFKAKGGGAARVLATLSARSGVLERR
jgi:hypothetical protein